MQVDCCGSREQFQVGVGGRRRPGARGAWWRGSARCAHIVRDGAHRTARAPSGTGAETIGGTSIFALVEMSLHVPPSAECFTAGRTPVSSTMNMAVVLKRSGMSEDLTAFVAAVATRGVGLDVEGFGNTV